MHCTSGYIFLCKFVLFHDYFCSQSWIIIYFCILSAFIQVCWYQVSWVFRFLHVHSHIDPNQAFLLKMTCSPNPNPRTRGPGLAGHLVLPYEPIHPLNVLDLIFFYSTIIIIIIIFIRVYTMVVPIIVTAILER